MSPGEQNKDGGGSDKKQLPVSSTLEDKRDLAYRVQGNRKTSSSERAGSSGDAGLTQPPVPKRSVSRDLVQKKSYDDKSNCVRLEPVIYQKTAGHGKAEGEKATKDGHTSPREKDSIPDHTSADQGSPGSLARTDITMLPLRRSQPTEFATGASNDNNPLELRQPNQRLVKIQPEEGQRRPGAYAHHSTRRFSDRLAAEQPPNDLDFEPMETMDETMLEEGISGLTTSVQEPSLAAHTTSMGVAGASVNDEDTLVSAPVELYNDNSPETIRLDSVNKKSSRRKYLLIGLAVLVVGAVGAGVGVALSGSKSDDALPESPPPSLAPTEEVCSMKAIEEECSDSTTGTFTAVPECLIQPREDLLSRLPSNLGVNVTEVDNDCSAENLAMLSVARYTSSEDSPTTLSNRLGLSLLFYATKGRGWVKGSDWVSSKPHCGWEGVFCEFEPDSVTHLIMEDFNMTGPLPYRIMSLLPTLYFINSQQNFLTGTIAPEFHDLSEFYVATNEFTGTLAPAFFESTSLYQLDLSLNRNLVVRSVPFIGTQWELLGLDRVTVEGDFLSSVTMLSNLHRLIASNVGHTGTIPTEIGRMTSLTELFVSGNPSLGGMIPSELQNLVKLRGLMLDTNALSGTIPSELGKLTELRDLVIGDNELSGGMPTELGLLTKLTTLLFQGNSFEGMIPSQVCSLKTNGNLEDFGLAGHATCVDTSGVVDVYGGLACPTEMPTSCCNYC